VLSKLCLSIEEKLKCCLIHVEEILIQLFHKQRRGKEDIKEGKMSVPRKE
jgi:hypothetical protein